MPNLIADMNSQDLEFTVQDGDLKGGNSTPGSITPTTCSDALYVQGLAYLNALNAPAMFTPGDNDWTDCDRPSNGGFSSLERLDHERAVFFSTLRKGTAPAAVECMCWGPTNTRTKAVTMIKTATSATTLDPYGVIENHDSRSSEC